MFQTAHSRAAAILLVLALVASPVLAEGRLETTPAGRTPSASGIASLWNVFLDGLIRVMGGSVAGPPSEAPPAGATPPPPSGDPDRGIMIDPWG
jgi:hypothetical protein